MGAEHSQPDQEPVWGLPGGDAEGGAQRVTLRFRQPFGAIQERRRL